MQHMDDKHRALIDDLQRQIEQLKRENQNLVGIVEGSDDDRVKEIARLQLELRSTVRSKEASGVFCLTLTEESVALKRRLLETVEMCQKLALSLDAQKEPRQKTVVETSIASPPLADQTGLRSGSTVGPTACLPLTTTDNKVGKMSTVIGLVNINHHKGV